MEAFIKQSEQSYQRPIPITALPENVFLLALLSKLWQVDLTPIFKNLKKDKSLFEEGKSTIKRHIRESWHTNLTPDNADWPRAVLGQASGDRIHEIIFYSEKSGVNGMLAGTPGSGKSVALNTIIMSLALQYSPTMLNFILVDFKGGNTFQPFKALPHCVDLATNLHTSTVDRIFIAIDAEVKRRQALITEAGCNDIVQYRKKTPRSKRGDPLPHLFVVLDEYAEFIDEHPDYRAKLESITRVGRSSGIYLILASQKPKGVTDQMRENIGWRFCLRVGERETSQEMLRRPNAAFLPADRPGQGYFQVGNASPTLIQTAFVNPKKQDMLVELIQDAAHGMQVPKPWPTELPSVFSLQTTLQDEQHLNSFMLEPSVNAWREKRLDKIWSGVDWSQALKPAVGLIDDPENAKRHRLEFDLQRRHLAVFGAPLTGKTTLLQTLLVNLASIHSPQECSMYIVDLGEQNFQGWEALPHVGTILYANDTKFEERFKRLLSVLDELKAQRLDTLRKAGGGISTIYQYNSLPTKKRGAILPAVIVAIDNFTYLDEKYEPLVIDALISLVQNALQLGIIFLITSNSRRRIPKNLYDLCLERVTFRQSDVDQYQAIMDRRVNELDDIPGRGYIKYQNRPLVFQAALPFGPVALTEDQVVSEDAYQINTLVQSMKYYAENKLDDYQKPSMIRILPEMLPLDQTGTLIKESILYPTLKAPLGMNNNLQMEWLDFRQTPYFSALGPPLSGKTTLLYSLVLSLAFLYPPDTVSFIFFDLERNFVHYGGNRSLSDLPHMLATISDVTQLEVVISKLEEECEFLAETGIEKDLFIIVDNYDAFCELILEEAAIKDLPKQLAKLMRKFNRNGLHFVVTGSSNSDYDDKGGLRKFTRYANCGIGLQTMEAVDALIRGARRPDRFDELPGRGYVIKSGHAMLTQVAVPLLEDKTLPQSLDQWVDDIEFEHKNIAKATWITGDLTDISPSELQNSSPSTNDIFGILNKEDSTQVLLDFIGFHQGEAKRSHYQGKSVDILLSVITEQLRGNNGQK